MAIVSPRLATKRRLVELLRERCPGVAVTAYAPGRDMKDRHIFLTATDGTVDYGVFAGPTMPRDDKFAVMAVVWVRHEPIGGSADDNAYAAEDECLALAQHVNAVIAERPTLDDLDGIIDVTLGSMAGPDVQPDADGWVASCGIEILVHSRMESY